MTERPDSDAWTVYWQANRLDSCISNRDEQDYVQLFHFWAKLVEEAPTGAAFLDLATGNGAVAVRLAQAARAREKTIRIEAVDLAAILPEKFLVDYQDLVGMIDFRGETDISALPHADSTFDVAVSQFGFEYAPRVKAAEEMLRVLRPGGRFCLMLHHRDSALVAPNIAKIEEIDALLASGGVVERVIAFLEATPDVRTARLVALEEAGQEIKHWLGTPLPRTSHEIFLSVSQLIERQDLTFEFRQQAAQEMKGRLVAEQDRMRQLSSSALTEAEAHTLRQSLEDMGASDVRLGQFRIGTDEALLAWTLTGEKPLS